MFLCVLMCFLLFFLKKKQEYFAVFQLISNFESTLARTPIFLGMRISRVYVLREMEYYNLNIQL